MTCLIVGSYDFINIFTVTVMITYINTIHSKIQSECVCVYACRPKFSIYNDEARTHDGFINIYAAKGLAAESTELRGHKGEHQCLSLGSSPDITQKEGDTSTCVSASAGDAVKLILRLVSWLIEVVVVVVMSMWLFIVVCCMHATVTV